MEEIHLILVVLLLSKCSLSPVLSRYIFRIEKLEVIGNLEYLTASSDLVYNRQLGKNLVSINASTIKVLKGLKVCNCPYDRHESDNKA